MKVNAKSVLNDVWGRPIHQPTTTDGGIGAPLTLADVCIDAMLRPHADDARAELAEIRKRHKLAIAFANEDEVELAAADATLLQRLIARTFGPAIVGPSCDLLDGQ